MSGQKNYCWVWIAIDRFARRFVSFVCESRGTETGMRLYDKISSTDVDFYCTDHCKCHEEILEPEFHIRSKAETFEGYNIGAGAILHGLKGKRYSKLSI